MICFLSACSSSVVERTSYYTLNGDSKPVSRMNKQCNNCKKVTVKVIVPSLIDNGGIAYYSGELQVLSKNNQWSESPSIQLQNLLVDQINSSTGPEVVAFSTSLRPSGIIDDAVLSVSLKKFNGSPDGYAEIEGTYIYMSGDVLKNGRFSDRVRQTEDGFPSLVSSLNEVWVRQCNNLIKDLF
jgi:uncharacterized lipoprotein YmbA